MSMNDRFVNSGLTSRGRLACRGFEELRVSETQRGQKTNPQPGVLSEGEILWIDEIRFAAKKLWLKPLLVETMVETIVG